MCLKWTPTSTARVAQILNSSENRSRPISQKKRSVSVELNWYVCSRRALSRHFDDAAELIIVIQTKIWFSDLDVSWHDHNNDEIFIRNRTPFHIKLNGCYPEKM